MRDSSRAAGVSRRAIAGVCTVVVAAMVAACGSDGGSGSTGGRTEVTFSYLWTGPEAEALEQIIADFNESQEEITVVGVSSPDTQKQLTAMSSSSGSFDISDNFGNAVGSWAAKGILEPLDEYLADAGVDLDDFVPAAMEQMRYDGQIYAMPIAVHDFQLLYNKTLLAEANVEPPTTLAELEAAIPKLTKFDASGEITQLGLGNSETSTTLTTLGYAFGGAWNTDDGSEPTPENPGNIAALEWWQTNITEQFGADKIATFTAGMGQYMSPEDPFYTGKVAMVIDGEWQAVGIKNGAPELDWGVTSIPVAEPALEGSTQLTASTLFIPANAEHKEEAAEFLAYLVDSEAMRDFSLALGNLPARTSLLADEAYAAIPQFDVWLEGLESSNVESLASQPYSAEYAADLATAFDDVVRGAASPEEAMAAVVAKADSYATD